jgi:hypothetical protein
LSDWLTSANIARGVPAEYRTKAIERETCRLKRRPVTTVQAMGYFWVGTSKLDDWTSLAIGELGLQAIDRGARVRLSVRAAVIANASSKAPRAQFELEAPSRGGTMPPMRPRLPSFVERAQVPDDLARLHR